MINFNFEPTVKDDIVIVKLIGSLIESSNGTLLSATFDDFIDKGLHKFILNMESFVYMNSSGLSVIINLLTKARKNDGDVIICNITRKNNDILTITKLNSVFIVCDNEEEAINSFK